MDAYTELSLGPTSKDILLKNFLTSLGYEWLENKKLRGLSGLNYKFDAIGVKEKSVLIIIGGAESDDSRRFSDLKERMEKWRDSSLLGFYDIQAALNSEGVMTDMVFFQNIYDKLSPQDVFTILNPKNDRFILKEYGFPIDSYVALHNAKEEIPILSSERLRDMSQNVGACFFSLSDFDNDNLIQITEYFDDNSLNIMSSFLKKIRVYNYFYPPADELLLSCMDKGRITTDQKEIRKIIPVAEKFGKDIQDNVLISDIKVRDPIVIAQSLS